MLTAKLRQIALVLGAGKVTLPYPAAPHPPAAGFRGLPAIRGEDCLGCGACARACPARLIELTSQGDRMILTADFTRCTYCARCADVCPTGAFHMTDRFETATPDPGRLSARIDMELLICQSCGKSMGTRHMALHAARKKGEPEPIALPTLCPGCRRKAAAQAAAAAKAAEAAQAVAAVDAAASAQAGKGGSDRG